MAWRRNSEVVEAEASIPPNTTARVLSPDGSHPFTVGAGERSWTVVDTHHRPRVKELNLKAHLADIIEDPDAYAAVLGS